MKRRNRPGALRKVLASGAILALALCPASPALAANGKGTTTSGSIKINQTISHTAYAYQVFDGDVEDDGSIADLDWGSGIDRNAIETALRNSTHFSSATSAKAVAEKLSVITYNSSSKTWVSSLSGPSTATSTTEEDDATKEFAEIVSRCLSSTRTPFNGLDNPVASGLDDGWYVVVSDYGTNPGTSAAWLFPGLITVGSGQSTVTPKESIPTFRKEVQEDSNSAWQEYADFEIGQTFNQRLIATIGDADLEYYKTYYLGFSDTLPDGQEILDLAKVTVTIDGVDKTSKFTKNYSNHKLTVEAIDIKNDIDANSEVIVTYETVLTGTAKIGSAGNVNKAKLSYSADPRTTQGGNSEVRSTTPEDTTAAYTYELKLTKSDSADASKTLAGAKFSLKRADGKFAQLKVYGGTAIDNATDTNTGNARVYVSGWVSTAAEAGYVTTGADGTASIAGLDAGDTYTLNEVVAPDGYDLDVHDIPFTISANPASNVGLSTLSVSVSGGAATNGDPSTGLVGMGATNVKAPVLPTTGLSGIATSVALGSGMVAIGATVIARQTSKRPKE